MLKSILIVSESRDVRFILLGLGSYSPSTHAQEHSHLIRKFRYKIYSIRSRFVFTEDACSRTFSSYQKVWIKDTFYIGLGSYSPSMNFQDHSQHYSSDFFFFSFFFKI